MPLIGVLHGTPRTAFADALSAASPVDRTVDGMEALYAAVVEDAELSGSDLVAVATSAGQLAYLVTSYQWHGKAQRGADILAAMRKVVEQGVASADAGGPEVDARFAPPPAPPAAQAA